MPTLDRKPRRRLSGATAGFTNEQDVRAAVDSVRALPEPEREAAWRSMLPAVRRWVMAHWRTPKIGDAEWLDAAARAYYLSGRFRAMLPPRRL